MKAKLELSQYKHIGVFPEQVANWMYIEDQVISRSNCRFLNLFAYTSIASIVAAKAGAEVVNVEALKQLNQWSKLNAELNHVQNVKWLVDDAKSYVERAVRRGEKFNGIILDPPAFGYGSKGKRWILEKDLPKLLSDVSKLLDPDDFFLIINTYSPKMPMDLLQRIVLKQINKKVVVKPFYLGLESNNSKQLELGNLLRITAA